MPIKAEERWKRLAATGAKGVIPTPAEIFCGQLILPTCALPASDVAV